METIAKVRLSPPHSILTKLYVKFVVETIIKSWIVFIEWTLHTTEDMLQVKWLPWFLKQISYKKMKLD